MVISEMTVFCESLWQLFPPLWHFSWIFPSDIRLPGASVRAANGCPGFATPPSGGEKRKGDMHDWACLLFFITNNSANHRVEDSSGKVVK